MFRVIEIVLQLLIGVFNRSAIWIHHLRPACNSGFYVMAQVVIGDLVLQQIHEVLAFRSWPDETHLATDDVVELGQFVQPALA